MKLRLSHVSGPSRVLVLAGGLGIVALAAAGCSPSGLVTARQPGGTGTASATPRTASRAPSAAAKDPADVLFAGLRSAAAHVRSEHVQVDYETGRGQVTAVGDEQLADGKVVAFRLAVGAGSQRATILARGGQTYIRHGNAKRWVRFDPDSASRTDAEIWASTLVLSGFGTTGYVRDLSTSASDVRRRLQTTVAGQRAVPWAFNVDPRKTEGVAVLLGKVSTTITTISTTLEVDGQGRALHLVQNGRDVNATPPDSQLWIEVSVSRYDQPVSITAPKPSEIAQR